MTTRSGGRSKNILQPHRKPQWVIAPEASAAFVANMEDVLDVYQRPHDPKRPLVCLDETSKQLIVDRRAPIAATPGQPERQDNRKRQDNRSATTTNTSAMAWLICS